MWGLLAQSNFRHIFPSFILQRPELPQTTPHLSPTCTTSGSPVQPLSISPSFPDSLVLLATQKLATRQQRVGIGVEGLVPHALIPPLAERPEIAPVSGPGQPRRPMMLIQSAPQLLTCLSVGIRTLGEAAVVGVEPAVEQAGTWWAGEGTGCWSGNGRQQVLQRGSGGMA